MMNVRSEDGGPAAKAWRSSRHGVTALAVALVFPLALAAAPGELFLRISRLEIYSDREAGAMVALERRFWTSRPVEASWTATVERLRKDEQGVVIGRVICSGAGTDTLGRESFERLHLVVREWLHDPECRVVAGENYALTATWRFAVLGLTKTVSIRTPPEPLPPLPDLLTIPEEAAVP
jgi:hypothetical protein